MIVPPLIHATTVLIAVGAGLFAAGHSASWGAYKDSPFEGFRWRSYLRTFLLAVPVSVMLSFWLPVSTPAAAIVLVGVTYALERLGTEWWKSIVRNDDQAAYTIPMRLGLFGRTVDRPGVRYAAGTVVVAIVALGLAGLHLAQAALPLAPAPVGLLVTLAVGSVGGWATAVGGAWKDAPIEGFSFWKFLRSPAVATAWAIPVAALTPSWPALVIASAGFAVVSIETYKTFFTRGRPPGKFAGKPVLAALPRVRGLLAVQNAAWWVAFAGLFAIAALAVVGAGPAAVLVGTVAAMALLVAPAVTRSGLVQARGSYPVLAA